jgi:transaldolase
LRRHRKEKALASKLDQLRAMTTVVADTGDLGAVQHDVLLNRAQAIASAEAGAVVISPFVGRIYDWHKKSSGKDFTADEDPGVRSVLDIHDYYKSNGHEPV